MGIPHLNRDAFSEKSSSCMQGRNNAHGVAPEYEKLGEMSRELARKSIYAVGFVMAPVSAPCTSFANFASTPVV